MWYYMSVLVQCTVVVLCFTKPETPCKRKDIECITNVSRDIVQSTLNGDYKELGVEVLDPLYQEFLEGNLPAVKFNLKNSNVAGFKDMIINEVKVIQPATLRIDMMLPHVEFTGDYKIEGKLLNLPIEGEGKYFLNATNIQTLVDTTKNLYEKDGKHYLKLTDIQTTSDLQGALHLDLENLFNGNKELAEPILQFINENPKLVANSWQTPIAQANMKKIFENFNKVLESIPLEDIVVLQ